MLFSETKLPGAFVIDLQRIGDERGSFARSFCEREFAEHDLPTHFPQCNLSYNRSAGTLRGMHFSARPSMEAKVVRCVSGAIYDVIVDIRPSSPTHLQWFGVELSAENGTALFVPVGFAHGFLTLCDESTVFYQMGDVYRPETARGFRWNDPSVAIAWPKAPVVIAERDANYPNFDPKTDE